VYGVPEAGCFPQTNTNEKDQSYQAMKSSVQEAMKVTFKPEFLNRCGEWNPTQTAEATTNRSVVLFSLLE